MDVMEIAVMISWEISQEEDCDFIDDDCLYQINSVLSEFCDETKESDEDHWDDVENTSIGKEIMHRFKGRLSKIRFCVDGKILPEDVHSIYAIIFRTPQ